MRRNQDIRDMIKEAGLRMWEVAEVYGINAGNFSCKLRYELKEADRNKIIDAINRLKDEKKQEV